MSCCAVQNFLCSNKSDFHCMQKIQCGQRMSKANGGYQRRTIRKIHIHLYPEYLSVSPRFEHQSRSQDRTSRFVTCLRFVASLLASVEPIPAPSDSRLIFNQPSVENSLGPTNWRTSDVLTFPLCLVLLGLFHFSFELMLKQKLLLPFCLKLHGLVISLAVQRQKQICTSNRASTSSFSLDKVSINSRLSWWKMM